jgi:3-deoxy-7-phosphoheptulonate synthase
MSRLPSYQELKYRFPLTASQMHFVSKSRQTIQNILDGKDSRLLGIIGPCSIHDLQSAKEFAKQLHELALHLSDHFFLIMRVYCEKPRTLAGWKGFLYDPFLDGSNQILTGIEWTRLLLRELIEMEVPTATEFLDPMTAFYYADLISWGSIGARTSSSQTHRQMASGLHMPIGFKNGLAGNLSAAIHGVMSASHSHTYVGLNNQGQPSIIHTPGNPHAHIVLRGGEPSGPNYDKKSIEDSLMRLTHHHLPQRLLIDCSHQNSGKKPENQSLVFQSVLEQVVEGNTSIKGFMLESHLYGGNQVLLEDPSHLKYGISITDGCLDWETTSQLLQWGSRDLQKTRIEDQKNRYVPSEALF